MTDIPFYKQRDSTQCFQACLKMILKYNFPERDFSWEELDQFSGKKPDKWTWPQRALINLSEMGFEVVNIEHFDYEKFIINPLEYMEEIYGKETAQAQDNHSDIPAEVENAKEFIKKIKTTDRIPDIFELGDMIKQGYVLILNINSRILQDREGYAGHFVILKNITDKKVVINDPGYENGENNEYSLEKFLKAWDYPDQKARNIMGVRVIKV